MKKLVRLAAFAALASFMSISGLTALPAYAEDGVVGVWKTIDDQTGKPKSLVRVTENNGVVLGKIEKLFREAGEEQNPRCDKCEGTNKDQPIIGMTILTGFKSDGNDYKDCKILDPKNGKLYQSTIKLDGNKLKVRGYIGISLFGRSQVWLREQ